MLKVKPVFSPKLWGGNKLKEKYGFDIESNDKIGEAWIISAYPGNSSITEDGVNLNTLYKTNRELFNNYHTEEFPLLAKILDANDDLSIQVHPNDEMAKELENYPFGKTECWYILDAEPNTNIIIGINAKDKNDAKKLIENNDWDNLLKKQKLKKGDLFNIEAGTVHAILGGTVVYELQQSSDITYRLYDFDRREADGSLRELHINKSLDVIDYDSSDTKRTQELISFSDSIDIYSLVENKIFSLEKWIVKDDCELKLSKNTKNFLLVTVVEGEVNINGSNLKTYESGIITSEELNKINIKGNAILLVGNPN